MRIDKKDFDEINKRMVGWTILKVDSGTNEDLFIFHLVKGEVYRTVILGGNDLGGWLVK